MVFIKAISKTSQGGLCFVATSDGDIVPNEELAASIPSQNASVIRMMVSFKKKTSSTDDEEIKSQFSLFVVEHIIIKTLALNISGWIYELFLETQLTSHLVSLSSRLIEWMQ